MSNRLVETITFRITKKEKEDFKSYCEKHDIDFSKLLLHYVKIQIKTYPQLLNYLDDLPPGKVLASLEFAKLNRYLDNLTTDAKLIRMNGNKKNGK